MPIMLSISYSALHDVSGHYSFSKHLKPEIYLIKNCIPVSQKTCYFCTETDILVLLGE
jgi:hypothetical protein